MLLTAGLFTLAFVSLKPLWPLAIFAGFGAVQIVSWVVPLTIGQHERRAGDDS